MDILELLDEILGSAVILLLQEDIHQATWNKTGRTWSTHTKSCSQRIPCIPTQPVTSTLCDHIISQDRDYSYEIIAKHLEAKA